MHTADLKHKPEKMCVLQEPMEQGNKKWHEEIMNLI